MKAFALSLTAAMAMLCAGAIADDVKPVDAPKAPAKAVADGPNISPDWTVFQMGFVPGAPSGTVNSTVRGLKLGIPMVSGDNYVAGLEPSFLYSGTNYVDGFQGTMVGATIARKVNGIQGAWFGYVQAKEVNGMQCAIGGCVVKNLSGWQPACVSVTTEKSDGCQIAFVTMANKEFNGCQVAAVNVANQELCGFQMGAVNYAKHNGVQFGVINVISDGWLPFCPLMNISFKDEKK